MIESLQNMDTLIPRLLPIACLFVLYLGIRIKFSDMVNNIIGQAKQPGALIRSVLSLLFIAASVALWLMGPQAVDFAKQQMSQHATEPMPTTSSVPFSSPAPTPVTRKPITRDFYPTILSSTAKSVNIDSKGTVMSIQQGMRTPSGWLLISSSPDEASFLDAENREVTIRYHDKSGRWMPVQ